MFRRRPKPQPEPQVAQPEVQTPEPVAPPKEDPLERGELRAQKFVLLDSDGKTRAQLQAAGKGGAVALTFHDSDEKMRLLLGLDPRQAPTLAMIEGTDKRVEIGVDGKSGRPHLSLKAGGGSEVAVRFDEYDRASISLCDLKGQARVRISLEPDGRAEVALYDEKGYVAQKLHPE